MDDRRDPVVSYFVAVVRYYTIMYVRCYGKNWYKYQISIVVCALIHMDLRERVMDERLVRLTYGMD